MKSDKTGQRRVDDDDKSRTLADTSSRDVDEASSS